MKAMVAAFVAMAVIAVGANFALERIGFSSEERATGEAVRLGD